MSPRTLASGLFRPGLFLLCLALTATAAAADNRRIVRDAVEVARELRGSDNIYDQLAAAGTLVEIGDKDSLQFLADNLGHPDWVLMRSAIDTLLNVEHPAGLDLIYRYAAVTEDGMFMKFLSESLASRPREDMGEFLMGALALDDTWVRKHALQALAVTPLDDKETRMRAIAEDVSQDRISRAYAWYALVDTPARPDSITRLIEIAHSGGSEAQEAAAVGLGAVENDRTRAALRGLREGTAYKVQVAALASEAGFGNEESMAELIYIIAHGKGLDASSAAASLRRLPAPIVARITDTLLECCTMNSDVGTRLLESWAQVESDPARLYDWGLANTNPDIRMQAVWLVGMRRDLGYLERIAPMLDDADSGIRGMTAWAIVRLAGEDYEPGVEI